MRRVHPNHLSSFYADLHKPDVELYCLRICRNSAFHHLTFKSENMRLFCMSSKAVVLTCGRDFVVFASGFSKCSLESQALALLAHLTGALLRDAVTAPLFDGQH